MFRCPVAPCPTLSHTGGVAHKPGARPATHPRRFRARRLPVASPTTWVDVAAGLRTSRCSPEVNTRGPAQSNVNIYNLGPPHFAALCGSRLNLAQADWICNTMQRMRVRHK